MKHIIVKIDSDFTCSLCTWTWKSRPSSSCPGVVRYAWGAAPKNLMTRGQLEKMKHKPGAERRGVVQGGKGEYSLFDRTEAIPFTPEEIVAEKERQHRARYGACKKCGKEFKREKLDERLQVCEKCLPAVAEAYHVRKKAEFESMVTRAADQAIRWARWQLAHPDKWVIVDTETTGLDSGDEVIQIAILDPVGQILLDELVNPISEIGEGAYRVHHISMEMLAGKPSIAALIPRLAELLPAGKKIIAYNASFDCRLLWQSLNRNEARGFDPFDYTWDDAMQIYANYCGEWDEYHKDFRWQPLHGGDHTAAGDCRATLELIQDMARTKTSEEIKAEETA